MSVSWDRLGWDVVLVAEETHIGGGSLWYKCWLWDCVMARSSTMHGGTSLDGDQKFSLSGHHRDHISIFLPHYVHAVSLACSTRNPVSRHSRARMTSGMVCLGEPCRTGNDQTLKSLDDADLQAWCGACTTKEQPVSP
jgi:hypothetical protein